MPNELGTATNPLPDSYIEWAMRELCYSGPLASLKSQERALVMWAALVKQEADEFQLILVNSKPR
jgi:hypothetical protein